MKVLYIARHAKSSWDQDWLDDFERPLNDRGKKDAPGMAQRLHEMGVNPDLIVTSPAARAMTTARIMAREFGYDLRSIRYEERLYDAVTRDIVDVIRNTENRYRSLMIFGHNPGFTTVASKLAGTNIDNIPTCGVVAIECDAESWNDVADKGGRLLFFEYPKKQKST